MDQEKKKPKEVSNDDKNDDKNDDPAIQSPIKVGDGSDQVGMGFSSFFSEQKYFIKFHMIPCKFQLIFVSIQLVELNRFWSPKII